MKGIFRILVVSATLLAALGSDKEGRAHHGNVQECRNSENYDEKFHCYTRFCNGANVNNNALICKTLALELAQQTGDEDSIIRFIGIQDYSLVAGHISVGLGKLHRACDLFYKLLVPKETIYHSRASAKPTIVYTWKTLTSTEYKRPLYPSLAINGDGQHRYLYAARGEAKGMEIAFEGKGKPSYNCDAYKNLNPEELKDRRFISVMIDGDGFCREISDQFDVAIGDYTLTEELAVNMNADDVFTPKWECKRNGDVYDCFGDVPEELESFLGQ